MRRRALAASAVLAAAFVCSVAASAQDWRTRALASFDEVWTTINDSYFDPSFGGLDWLGVRAALRPAVETARDEADARRVIRDMLGRLGQSHFALLSPAAAENTLPGPATVRVEIRLRSNGLVIMNVEPGSTAARAGLRAGDRITAIDGEDVGRWIAEAQGDERARAVAVWQRGYRALHGAPRSSVRLALIHADGSTALVTAPRQPEAGTMVTVGNLPPLYARIRVSEARTPARHRVGVIAFNFWMTAIAAPFAEAVDRFRHADGLVIDLRGNPGGLAEMMRGIAGHVLAEPALLGRIHMRGADLEFRANPRRSTADGRRVEPYAGPVALLVDELTASTSECFAGSLQSLGRARVFGTVTRGEALPAATRRLSNGDVLLYAIGDFVTSTGQRLERQGVIPDKPVPFSMPALAAGRDPVLEAAMAWIDSRP